MATIIPIKFGDESFQFGDGGSPTELFSEPCGITGRSRNFSINTQSDDLPDCDDPNAVAFDAPYKISIGESVDLQFVVNAAMEPLMRDLAYNETDTNARYVINKGTREGYYEGPGILTALQFGSERRGNVTGTATWTWTAKPTWVPAP